MADGKTHRVSLDLDDKTYRQLKTLALDEGRPAAAVLREAFEYYLSCLDGGGQDGKDA